MKNNFLKFFVITILACSCSPTISTFIDKDKSHSSIAEPVYIFTMVEKVPEGATPLGLLNYNSRSTNNCTFKEQYQLMTDEAKKYGANLIKIKSIEKGSANCFDVEAEIYYFEDAKIFKGKDKDVNANENNAKIYFYSIDNSKQIAKKSSYTLRLNKQSYKVERNAFVSVEAPKGRALIEIDNNSKEGRYLEVENGKSYYVKLYVDSQSLQPSFKIMPSLQGRIEYEYAFLDDSFHDSYVHERKMESTENQNNDDIDDKRNQGTDQEFSDQQDNKTRRISEISFERAEEQSNRLRLSSSGGISNRLGQVPPNLPDDVKSLSESFRTGYFIDFEASFFLDNQNGISLYFNRFYTSTSELIETDLRFGGALFSNEFVNSSTEFLYYGINYTHRVFVGSKDKNQLIFSVGVGGMSYLEDNRFENGRVQARSDVFAFNTRLNYDIYLGGNFYLGFNVGLIVAINDNYRIDNGFNKFTFELDDDENFSRIEAGLGLRYNF